MCIRILVVILVSWSASMVSTREAMAGIIYTTAAVIIGESFDSLVEGGPAFPWQNDSTLAGWHLYTWQNQPPLFYASDDGSTGLPSFYNFGSTFTNDRSLGSIAATDPYFENPAPGSVAGYIAVEIINGTGQTLDNFYVGYQGEQWHNGGNTSAQSLVFEWGIGSTFTSVSTWHSPGGNFDFVSPVTGPTAGPVDGNSTGLVGGRGGFQFINGGWANGDTLWLRWVDFNDVGGNHGLSIDNWQFEASAVPEPAFLPVMIGLSLGFTAMQRRRLHRNYRNNG